MRKLASLWCPDLNNLIFAIAVASFDLWQIVSFYFVALNHRHLPNSCRLAFNVHQLGLWRYFNSFRTGKPTGPPNS